MTDQDGVRITQREVYDKVVGLEDGLGRVEALLEQHVALEQQRNEGVEVRLENHGTRLADLGTQHASLEGRVTTNEGDIRSLREAQEAQEKRNTRKATWPQVVAAVVAMISGVGLLGGIFVALTNMANAISATN